MIGEMPNDAERSGRDRRQPLAELGQDPRLDMHDQAQEHIIEQLDLLGIVLVRMGQKQVGHAPECYNAPVIRTGLDRLVQLSKEGMAHTHGCLFRAITNGWQRTCGPLSGKTLLPAPDPAPGARSAYGCGVSIA